MKNILKYFLCFIISFSLLLSFSYAEFNSSTLPTYMSLSNTKRSGSISFSSSFLPNSLYTTGDVLSTINSYYTHLSDPSYKTPFDSMINYFTTNGINVVIWTYYNSGTGSTAYYVFMLQNNVSVGVYPENTSTYRKYLTYIDSNSSNNYFYVLTGNTNNGYYYSDLYNIAGKYTMVNYDTITNSNSLLHSTCDIKEIYNYGYWDGSTYYYQTTPPEPSYIPTNSEIADKVQEFYDSDFFQNQSDFKDFFVLYNYNNETFSFIGHNLDTHIGQYIETENYPGNTTGLRWWKFYLTDASTHIWNWFNNNYWLYSTTLSSDTISYNGKGAVTDLLELKFDSRYSTIVYSTTDYHVEILDWDDDNNESIITQEIIEGDFYTYDENLDPTTSQYNPVTNFIPPSAIDTTISNAKTDELIAIWSENIPDFTELAWLFTCVGLLWGYFGSYILIFCLLIFILHIVRGN